MGRLLPGKRKSKMLSPSNSIRKDLVGFPLDVTESLEDEKAATGPIHGHTSELLQGSAIDATAQPLSTPAPAAAGGTRRSVGHAEQGMFTEQLQRLRARLQSVVQGVREVAQSLDEPHSLIANVRDQLQTRHDNARRNSQSFAPTSQPSQPSLARNSTGGAGPFKGSIPEGYSYVPESRPATDLASLPLSAEGANSLSVRARVAAVEQRNSRSGGGLSEPLPVLPCVLEMKPSADSESQEDGAMFPSQPVSEVYDFVSPGSGSMDHKGATAVNAATAASAVNEEQAGEDATPQVKANGTEEYSESVEIAASNTAAEANAGKAIAAGTEAAAGATAGGGSGSAAQECAGSHVVASLPDTAASTPRVSTGGSAVMDAMQAFSRTSSVGTRSRAAGGVAAHAIEGSGSNTPVSYSRSVSMGGGSMISPTDAAASPPAPAPDTAAAVAAADLVAAHAVELLSGRDVSLVAATANAAAAAAYLKEHPETLRELWTLRARVRLQERELASMVKQLSTKNAQLDQAQTTVQQKEKELGAITKRLTGVLTKLQSFQATHNQQQQELHALQQQQRASAGGADPLRTPSSSPDSVAPVVPVDSPRTPFTVPSSSLFAAGIAEEEEPQAAAFSSDAAFALSSVLRTPPGSVPMTTPRTSGSRRNSMARQHRVFSLRDAGPSLEVYMPPPPPTSMWVHEGPGSVPEQPLDEAAAYAALMESLSSEEPQAAEAEALAEDASASPGAAVTSWRPADDAVPAATDVVPKALPGDSSSVAEVVAEVAAEVATTSQTSEATTVKAPVVSTDVCAQQSGGGLSSAPISVVAATETVVRRRSIFKLLLQFGPSLACVALLMRDASFQRGLEQVLGGVSKTKRINSVASRHRALEAAAAARTAPLDIGQYLPTIASSNGEAFESPSSRECKAKWCKLIRPPPKAAVYY